ncbi:hypothetical protein Q8A67_021967 [Cirrhinus molitorella]|uniref:Uncharacterized protein n=1 Tax=Cirrhinus molitorella TaxID=172907 RepID=A0AA88P4H2_9TELE|nr:hypothetical protein Q8A67_021967 [Cirrhinus molitorella]
MEVRAQTAGACVCTHAVNGKREIAGVHEPLTACVAVPAGNERINEQLIYEQVRLLFSVSIRRCSGLVNPRIPFPHQFPSPAKMDWSESVPAALRCVWESAALCVRKQRTRWSIESRNNEARWISGSRVGRRSEWGRSVGSRHRPELSHIPHWRDLQLDTDTERDSLYSSE